MIRLQSFFCIIGMILFLNLGILAETPVSNYKIKSSSNEKERNYLLDLLRAKLSNEFKQEFIFVVDHFKVSGDYAWFRGTAQRKDGKEISFSDEMPYDCCHVEALFKRTNGKWQIAESAAFSTDVWWEGIQGRYPNAAKEIFL
ncbi:hypothetical protein NUH30_16670 [Leptospira sp. 85282-16]|uniref:DUF4440 domain-containing protein n=1 Tax=Leptospira montravelensis TaxID=2484961 RepID=A0ABY2LS54_9LEPT|nr:MULTISPECIES: hypothetical protein [Leptospira]MCT8335317.1 hypothetical protein [Leptospira sp. 85282-16]TGK78137.1 hypothetical protein EHQ19_18645 [Leptospira montravelensis]TGL03816.1 hypothetical protein EHQ31_06870 [Leptospira montravelensis]